VPLLAIAARHDVRDRPPHRRGRPFTHPKPHNFGSGIRRAEENELGQEAVVRSEAAAPGLSVGQEGHAGAENVIGEGAAVRAGGRLGSFPGGAAPGDHQRTDHPRRCRPVLWARRGPARTGVLAYLVAWVIIPGEGQQNFGHREHRWNEARRLVRLRPAA
jgi:hypothetical protein